MDSRNVSRTAVLVVVTLAIAQLVSGLPVCKSNNYYHDNGLSYDGYPGVEVCDNRAHACVSPLTCTTVHVHKIVTTTTPRPTPAPVRLPIGPTLVFTLTPSLIPAPAPAPATTTTTRKPLVECCSFVKHC